MRRTTLRDVARHLNLNESTISRGLRNEPRIPLQTRKRIQAAAQELGYRPDCLLSQMGSARWQRDKMAQGSSIAYLGCERAEQADVAPLVREQAAVLGYHVEVFQRREFASSSSLQRTLRNRGLTNILIGPITEESLLVELDWPKFICVQLIPGFFPLQLNAVSVNHFNAVALAWRTAVNYGYRRIGIIFLDHHFPLMDDVMRITAAHTCQHQFFPHLAAIPPFHSTMQDWRPKECTEWVQRNQLDAVIDFNGTHDHLRFEFGPQLGYCLLHTNQSQGISGISELRGICAREGVNLLHYCQRTNQWGLPSVRIDHVIEPTWFEGTSMPKKTSHQCG
jgi:DNA-binding LacI/PurR family transcriptional regulator